MEIDSTSILTHGFVFRKKFVCANVATQITNDIVKLLLKNQLFTQRSRQSDVSLSPDVIVKARLLHSLSCLLQERKAPKVLYVPVGPTVVRAKLAQFSHRRRTHLLPSEFVSCQHL